MHALMDPVCLSICIHQPTSHGLIHRSRPHQCDDPGQGSVQWQQQQQQQQRGEGFLSDDLCRDGWTHQGMEVCGGSSEDGRPVYVMRVRDGGMWRQQ